MRPSTVLAATGVSLALVLAACSGEDPIEDGDADDAHRLVVDLQGGFDSDAVQIVVNGRAVAQLDDVVTDEMLGLAESVEVEVPAGTTTLAVRIGDANEIGSRIEVDGDRFVGVNVDGGEIVLDVSTQPFGYG